MQAWFPLALVAVVLWGLWGFLAKVSADAGGLSAASAAAWQGVGGLVVVLGLAMVLRFRVDVAPRASLAATAAGLALFLGILAFVAALAAGGPASVVVPLTGLYPLVAVALGVVVLGERLSVTEGVGVACAVVAVVLLSQ